MFSGWVAFDYWVFGGIAFMMAVVFILVWKFF